MAIIKKQQLIEKINDYNLLPLEVSVLKISNQIHLKLDEIEEFLKFASDSNLKYVYYFYTYYHSGEYIIPSDWYSEYSKEFKAVVRQHNQQIKSLDFDSPQRLTLFILQNGTFVGVELNNFWIENQGISVAEEIIEVFENKFYREVKKISANKKVQQKDDENELREIIFNDPEFKLCKNQALRYRYLIELLEKENMMKYDYLVQPYGYHKDGKVKWFMDKTWELFKERKK
ncbi:hypothetical protein KW850_27625 [Bacillus sp. sid0103]|uniref:hypothetical protein n=1 Tax=Bacillus sp. sid0103 TaxID=2856337 RepID=UPI001C4372C1|nr:hypothetical protein [Bacillus sp. sid0103]MBV7508977.1 hypothetical protein [Bacillus sp. sid0103]